MDDRTQLSAPEIEALRSEYPRLPAVYLNYLREIGWGETPSGHMVYSGPITPDEVYSQIVDDGRVIIGDDMQGYCLAYDFRTESFGEYSDFGEWSAFASDFDLPSHLSEDHLR